MPIPAGCYQAVIQWTPDDAEWPGEIAQNTLSFNVVATAGAVTGRADGIAQGVVDALQAAWSGLQSVHGSGYGITGVKVSELDTAGHVVAVGFVGVDDNSLNGTGGSILPPECAICLSLYNYAPGGFAVRRGTKRGRIYLPYINQAMCGGDGKISSGNIGTVLDGWNAILTALNPLPVVAGTVDATVGVLSRTAGTFVPLNHICCDNHFDSQRRRQHQSPATQICQALITV